MHPYVRISSIFVAYALRTRYILRVSNSKTQTAPRKVATLLLVVGLLLSGAGTRTNRRYNNHSERRNAIASN